MVQFGTKPRRIPFANIYLTDQANEEHKRKGIADVNVVDHVIRVRGMGKAWQRTLQL